MRKKRSHPEHPVKGQLFVAASEYYRQRADVERGLQKRDFPALDDPHPLEKNQETLLNEGKPPPCRRSRVAKKKASRHDRWDACRGRLVDVEGRQAPLPAGQ
jgi:hypothetical protein